MSGSPSVPEIPGAASLAQLFIDRARDYIVTEYRTKLRVAVEALPSDRLWWRANDSSNSVGNLLLHLIGSTRQWIVSGIAGTPDVRHRAGEFAARGGLSAPEFVAELERLFGEVDHILGALRPEALMERRTIQGRDITVFEAVLNVIQHFSHHVGQVIWIAKFHSPGAVHFVEDAKGIAHPRWRELVRPLDT